MFLLDEQTEIGAKPSSSCRSTNDAGGESVREAGKSDAADQGGSSSEATAVAGSSEEVSIASREEPEASNSGNNEGVGISVEGKKWLQYQDLMSDSYPAKSKLVYLKAYKAFERFLKSRNQWTPDVAPSDLQVMNYFYFLRHEMKFAPTTLWSTYARINAVMKRLYGVSLNSYKRVSDVLKSYESGHSVKQAGIFTPQQIEDFVTDPELSSKYWLVRKVVCLIGYYGGFRNVELKSLKFENCELDCMGYWFHFTRSKQRGRQEETSICVPRRQPDWIPVKSDSSRIGIDFDPASVIDLYLAEVQNDLQCSREELQGDFFRATHGMKGQKFTKLTLGKNTIGKVGVQVATELCLPKPQSFTGHCWRRSCGTSASDSGVNVTTLMAMMGWSNPKTAMVYVKKSRMTSLSLSLYLANVQRSNCSNPFPRTALEKQKALKQTAVVDASVARSIDSFEGRNSVPAQSGSVLKVDDSEVQLATQELLREIEAEESVGGVGLDFKEGLLESVGNGGEELEVVIEGGKKCEGEKKVKEEIEGGESLARDSVNVVPVVDPRMSSILHNLRNSGNITINFNFDRK